MKHQKLFVIFVLSFVLFLGKSFSQENKILFKINNEIITSLDILEETNYLSAINDEFNKVKKNSNLIDGKTLIFFLLSNLLYSSIMNSDPKSLLG